MNVVSGAAAEFAHFSNGQKSCPMHLDLRPLLQKLYLAGPPFCDHNVVVIQDEDQTPKDANSGLAPTFRTFPVNSAVLSAESGYFHRLFFGACACQFANPSTPLSSASSSSKLSTFQNWASPSDPNHKAPIEIRKFPGGIQTFELVLRIFHQIEMDGPLAPLEVPKLLLAADFLLSPRLKWFCSQALLNRLPSNQTSTKTSSGSALLASLPMMTSPTPGASVITAGRSSSLSSFLASPLLHLTGRSGPSGKTIAPSSKTVESRPPATVIPETTGESTLNSPSLSSGVGSPSEAEESTSATNQQFKSGGSPLGIADQESIEERCRVVLGTVDDKNDKVGIKVVGPVSEPKAIISVHPEGKSTAISSPSILPCSATPPTVEVLLVGRWRNYLPPEDRVHLGSTFPMQGVSGEVPEGEETESKESPAEFFERLANEWALLVVRSAGYVQQMIRSHPIPTPLRGRLWQLLVVDGEARERKMRYARLYEKLKASPSTHEKAIRRDLHRTFPNAEMFVDADGEGQRSLFYVLNAYACFDNKVGYAQGMAFVAGLLLMHMDSESAFWTFLSLMQDDAYRLRLLYGPGVGGLHLLIFQIDYLVKLHLPEIWSDSFMRHVFRSPANPLVQKRLHLHEGNFGTDVFVPPFVPSLFIGRTDLATGARVLDLFASEGYPIFPRIFLALLKANEHDILHSPAEMILYILNAACQPSEVDSAKMSNPNATLMTALRTMGEFPVTAALLSDLERVYWRRLKQQQQQQGKKGTK